MAIFLLLYIMLMIVWLSWSAVVTYVLLKYRYPDKIGLLRLGIYWAVCAVFLVVSLIAIMGADWVTVPDFFKSMGA